MEAPSEVLGCEGNLLAPLTTDMMEKIAMSPHIRGSIFPRYYRGPRLSLRRSQLTTREAGIHLELVALVWVVNVWTDMLCTQGSLLGHVGYYSMFSCLTCSSPLLCQETQGIMCSFLSEDALIFLAASQGMTS